MEEKLPELNARDIEDSTKLHQLMDTYSNMDNDEAMEHLVGERYTEEHIADDRYRITLPEYETGTEQIQEEKEEIEEAYRVWDRLSNHISTHETAIYRYNTNPARQVLQSYDFRAEALYSFLKDHTLKGGYADGHFISVAIDKVPEETVRIPDLDVADYPAEKRELKQLRNEVYGTAKDGDIDIDRFMAKENKRERLEKDIERKMEDIELDETGEPRKELRGVGMSSDSRIVFEGYPGEDAGNYASSVVFLDPRIDAHSVSTLGESEIYVLDQSREADGKGIPVRKVVAPSESMVSRLKDRF
ncbi:MAG: hypothetical protein SVU32_04430 [Candidatus Nanohaloarchaea archaeon]|nr:hypothetical protein [Candidatus Nanohaloarchaea archaeon]